MSRQAALSLYRRSLKLALDWAVQRQLWRGQALYIRSLFEANRHVIDPRQKRVCGLRREFERKTCLTSPIGAPL
ncbi:NADH dehydrogenase 1 beta subcomplex subunit 9 [Moelleriella libera RCEF 2490]|uniref:NADH dehydrogenase [ubiquinone] 1 beta subcomplex subunit 9 n=1 Tax=Moelleriella libera RCEF 2490 TaxID=1081109 RepID=A0A168A3L1_9HYPO|nr:NADH dehydrogenase 1 beta subcomplex subunit 9 [Moelleriella libera RCEF 2490]